VAYDEKLVLATFEYVIYTYGFTLQEYLSSIARGRAENSLHFSQGANSKMIALYAEKSGFTRIMISTNGVTHILFRASLAQSPMVLRIFAVSFYGVISHIKLTAESI